MRWPKYWSFSFSISPSSEHPGLISFRMDWLDLLAVQGTLKSLLQHHSSKASVLRCSAFFTVQLSHPYMTNGKTIALTRQTFVGKVMSLLLNMLSRLVITFLPRSKCLLISWLQSPSAVILEPQKIKSNILSTVSPSISHEVMGPDAMILVFWMLSFQPTFSLSSFTFIKRLFSSSSLSAIRVVSSAYLIEFLMASNPNFKKKNQLWAGQIKYICKTSGYQRGRKGERDREFEIDMYTLLYLKWITNKALPYSTWNSAQRCVTARMGGEFEGEWIHVHVWLSFFVVHMTRSQHC